ncbi:splicing factor CC1-like protein [Moesziomyces antarcticus]|uniref:Related to RNA-binding region containing protein 2 n=1 Tax=Pseudozyma antarctica TaxID=84753 RepID=A0A5C3FF99_PSEA2|nr:splicing factor CC1-like protein [Moesziomyces antarcticus]GAK62510.1 splicing factor CC1-like protein [Moesziomyces antarcticus]SPO43064.1 related to RNA-binding region containing protein 2 [Moesziomyces antarcticus]
MYADLEEARTQRGSRASRGSRGSDREIDRSIRSGNGDADAEDGIRSREKELAEQLRKRAQASRAGARGADTRGRGRSSSVSSRSSRASSRDHSPSRSRSRSRSRSQDSYRSRKSHQSRRSARADEAAEQRRKRRRGDDLGHRSDRSRLDEDEDERARERRRIRSERRDDDRDGHSSAGDRHRASPAPSSSRGDRDRYDSYYEDRRYDRRGDRGPHNRGGRYVDDSRRSSRRRGRYDSPSASVRSRRTPSPEINDYEDRSVFCSQLSARLGQRDLGEFFEEHLGEGAVQDVRIVMDRVTRRSKGVGYVEFAARELVPKAIELTGKVLFGIPIVVQRTDAARNGPPSISAVGPHGVASHPALGGPHLDARALANVPMPMQYHQAGAPIHLNVNAPPGPRAMRPGPNMPNTEARLYVGSLHFSLTDENVKAVFEPFGEIEYVDLHREPGTGKSKGFCFIQFKHADDARKAHEAMNGFELAGRAIRVGNVNAKGSGSSHMGGPGPNSQSGGHLPQLTSAFDDGGGAGLNPERRAALMQKLARNNEPSPAASEANTAPQERPAGIPEATSTSLLLKNMFDPAEETEADWDKELAEDVKDECQAKYGPVTRIHVEKESAGEIYLTFADLDASRKALDGLNGRFFGGKPISAQYIPDAFVQAKLG